MAETAIDRIASLSRLQYQSVGERSRAVARARAQEIERAGIAIGVALPVFEAGDLQIQIEQVVNHQGRHWVEVFARAWKGGRPIGFGADGSVEIERFVIRNPPLLVPADDGPILRDGKPFREGVVAGFRRALVDTIRAVGKPDAAPLAGKRGASTYTIYGDATDGYCQSVSSSTYSTAQASAASADTSSTVMACGQRKNGSNYDIFEGFLAFDTSGVTGSKTSATLSLYGGYDASDTNFVYEARLHDWGASLTEGDWVAAGSLSSKTLLASINTSSWASAYMNLTSEAAFLSNINTSGFTRMVTCSDRVTAGTQPTGDEYTYISSADETGTTQDPKLVITADAIVNTMFFAFS